MPESSPLNYCTTCKEDFGSTRLFDRHRVGVHAYLYAEGLKMSPARKDGRRCLSIDEMYLKGWTLDSRGRWVDPASVAQVRKAFAKE